MSSTVAIVGIVVAGVVGPALGYVAAWRVDQRRFNHERRLKISDDLRERADEVGSALERLGEAAADLRLVAVTTAETDLNALQAKRRVVFDRYQVARVSIVRLSMRPGATAELVAIAGKAALEFNGTATAAREALVLLRLGGDGGAERAAALMLSIPSQVDEGYGATNEYVAEARRVLDSIVGPR